MMVNMFLFVLLTCTLLSLCRVNAEVIYEWTGGTNDAVTGASHVFQNVDYNETMYLTVEVYETDFSGAHEYVNGVFLNGELVVSHCDPDVDAGGDFYLCLKDYDVTDLLNETSKSLWVNVTASVYVNSYPHQGKVLYVRYRLNTVLEPTHAPSGLPSAVPTLTRPTAIPTDLFPTSQPSVVPSAMPATSQPTYSRFPTSQPSGQPSGEPSCQPSTSFPTLDPSFFREWVGGTNNVTEGASHTFTGVNFNTTDIYLKVEVFNTDFDDDNEFIENIFVNGVSVAVNCNPSVKRNIPRAYFLCAMNIRVKDYLDPSPHDLGLTVRTVASSAVNCCPEHGHILHVRYSLAGNAFETVQPTSQPSTTPSHSTDPTGEPSSQPSSQPTNEPTGQPTSEPSSRPTSEPSAEPSGQPSAVPSSSAPSLGPEFYEVAEFGTNHVVEGAVHTFSGLSGFSKVYAKVEVYENDYSDPTTEYITDIMANGHTFATNCAPGADQDGLFHQCLYDVDVSSFVNQRTGKLTIRVKSTVKVNSYPYNGYLLYVKVTLSSEMIPTGQPTGDPSVQPSARPSGQPTGEPSTEPTSEPTSAPTSAPTSEPSGQPSANPTAQPSTDPSAEPSSQPTGEPTSSVPTSIPTYDYSSPFVWVGGLGGGNWNDGRNWNQRHPPRNDSDVLVVLHNNETIVISESVQLHSLYFEGGRGCIDLQNEGTLLQISSMFNFSSGGVVSSDNCTACGVVNLNYTLMGTDSRKYLKNVTFTNAALLEWLDGDVIVSGAILDNLVSGDFVIRPVDTASSELRMKADESWEWYQERPGWVLNTEVNLDYVLPFGDAVYDMIVANGVLVGQSKLALLGLSEEVEIWPLKVNLDAAAADYYAHHVGFPLSYNYSMYNESLINVDQDQCASACLSSGWCMSFDYYAHSSLCLLSYFTAAQIGGLSAVQSHAVSVSHFEWSATRMESVAPSVLLNSGSLRVISSAAAGAVAASITLEVSAVLAGNSTTTVTGDATLTFTQGGVADATASVTLCNATLVFDTGSFNLSSSTFIGCECDDVGSSTVVYQGGRHVPSSNMHNVSLTARAGATVIFEADLSESLVRDVVVTGLSSVSWVNTAALSVDTLEIEEGGELLVSSIVLTSRFVSVASDSKLSSSGSGAAQSSGIGAGADHALGASGGAHGGRGGSAAADATAQPYGSAVWPNAPGSGGGRGGFEGAGGAGGGVISLICAVLNVDGIISSDGLSGFSGGGGGSGGSVLIKTAVLRGTGMISARGGEGGFSGGLVAGGGGAGGRVAMHTSTLLEYEGCWNIAGGFRPDTYDVNAEMAASGSVYFNASVEGVEVLALVFAAQNVCNMSESLGRRTAVGSQMAVEVLSGAHRESTVLDNSSSLGVVDVHIIGNVPILFSAIDADAYQTVNVSSIIVSPAASEVASVKVGALTELHFASNSLHLTNMKLHAFNTTLASQVSISVGASGHLLLYSSNTSGAAFDFGEVKLLDNGMLTFQNRSISVRGSTLTLLNESSLVLCQDDASLEFVDVAIYNSVFSGRGGPSCEVITGVSTETAPTVTFIGLDYAMQIFESLTLDDVGLVNNAYLNISSASVALGSSGSFTNNGVVRVYGASSFTTPVAVRTFDSDDFLCSSPDSSYYTSNSPPQLVQMTSGEFIAEEGSVVNVEVSVFFQGEVVVRAGDLFLQRGGTCDDCVINISLSGHVTFQGSDVFVFTEKDAYLRGQGVVQVEGIVRYPIAVNATPATTITDGCLLLDYARSYSIEMLTVVDNGSVFSNNSITDIDALEISRGGSLFVRNDIGVKDLFVDFGTFDITTSNCTISDKLNFTAGYLSGSGTIIIDSAANFYFTSDENATTSSYVLQVSIINYGTVHVRQQTVYWGRAGYMYNYGLIDFATATSYEWLPAADIYSFNRHKDTEMTRWEGIWEVISNTTTSQDACATECLNTDWKVSRQGGFHKLFMDSYDCLTFSYNQLLGSCRIHIVASDTEGSTVDDSARGEFAWDVFTRVSSWVGAYTLVNMESGAIHQHASSTSSVSLSIVHENHGLLSVSSAATFSVLQPYALKVGGSCAVNGTLAFEGGSVIEGELAGNGLIEFSGGTHLVNMSLDFSTFAISVSNGAMLTVSSGVSKFTGSSLTVTQATLTFMGPIGLDVEYVTIQGGGIVRSDSSAIASFTTGFFQSEAIQSGDIDLNVTYLLIVGNSSLEVSAGRIRAREIGISENATLSCAGRGYSIDTPAEIWDHQWAAGQYDLMGSSGGSHGGIGAGSRNIVALNSSGGYGSIFYPDTWGAPGGGVPSALNGSTPGNSAGGGALYISASEKVIVNGTIDCGGLSPAESLQGGGAGGSLHLRVKSLGGTGRILAMGGSGGEILMNSFGRGGGGGGGRIAVYYEYVSGFTGEVKACGGSGYDGLSGTAGTVYWKYVGADPNSVDLGGDLVIDNDNHDAGDVRSVLADHRSPFGVYNSITVSGGAQLNIQTNGSPVAMASLIGDSTGSVYLTNGTVLQGLNGTSSQGRSFRTHAVSVYVRDAILDATDIEILDQGFLYFSEMGSTLGSSQANYTFDSLQVFDGGEAIVGYQDRLLCGSNTSAVLLNVRNVSVYEGGAIHADGTGFSGVISTVVYDSNKEQSNGVGFGSAGSAGGGGGGHGGSGADGFKGVGGVAYDSYISPQLCGSGGGGGNSHSSFSGGEGGGVLHLRCSILILHGRLSADGVMGDGSGGGGGAGGSISVVTDFLNGTGTISARGGEGTFNSNAYGGGGSGGRISLRVKTDDAGFLGQVTASGGTSNTSSEVDPERSFLRDIDTGLLEWFRTMGVKRAASGTIFREIGPEDTISRSLTLDNIATFHLNLTYTATTHQMRNITLQNETHLATQADTSVSEVFGLTSAYSTICVDNDFTTQVDELFVLNAAALEVCNESTLVVSGSLQVDSSAELYLPSSATVVHLNESFYMSEGHLKLFGSFYSSRDLTLILGARLSMYPSASWQENDNSMPAQAGLFNVSRVSIYDSSGITFFGTNVTDTVQMPSQYMYCEQLQLVGAESYISADGTGYPGSPVYVDQHTSSAFQANGNITYGNGGFHAGSGGGLGFSVTFPSFYGSAYEPDRYGAGGGSTYQHRGGAGGGALRIVVESRLLLDGRISARGESCTSGNITGSGSGGGAGGSIWVNVLEGNLTGSGTLSVAGGNGCEGGGGGGSGGRIAVYDSTTMSSFEGSVVVHAGWQADFSNGTDLSLEATLPSGGTFYAAQSDGLDAGVLVVDNSGGECSEVFSTGNELTSSAKSRYLDEVVIAQPCTFTFDGEGRTIVRDIVSLSNTRSYIQSFFAAPASEEYGTLKLSGGAEIFLDGNLFVNGFNLEVEAAVLLIRRNSTVGENTTFSVTWNSSTVSSLQESLLTFVPTSAPSSEPSGEPTTIPSSVPTFTVYPTKQPSSRPSTQPSSQPSSIPTWIPTQFAIPTSRPSSEPSSIPSSIPSGEPSVEPSSEPSSFPTPSTTTPSSQPSSTPTLVPNTDFPSSCPTCAPSSVPSFHMTAFPTSSPTIFVNESGILTFNTLTIMTGGKLVVAESPNFYASSLQMNINYLDIHVGGALLGEQVVTSTHTSWSGTASSDNSDMPIAFGDVSNGISGGGGGGHAGAGTAGSSLALPGTARGFAADPKGGGGPGGAGPSGGGGSGGAGLLLVVSGDMRLNGRLSVSGGSAALWSGGGGGAGGSIYVRVQGFLSGNGTVTADGGHGSVSEHSMLYGGGGSGGRIKLKSCSGSFVGVVSALGGLSVAPASVLSTPSAGVYKTLQDLAINVLDNLELYAGAAGTVIHSEGYCSEDDLIGTQTLQVSSWSDTDLATKIPEEILSVLNDINISTSEVTTSTSVFTFDDSTDAARRNDTMFESVVVSNSKASLYFEGNGILSTATLITNNGTSIVIAEDSSLDLLGNYNLSNSLTLTLLGTLESSNPEPMDLTLSEGAFLHLGEKAAHSMGGVSNSRFSFRRVLMNNATLQGPRINISAFKFDMENHALITAEALGYAGCEAGVSDAQGEGAGSNDDAGGGGGGHGGKGMYGLSAMYLETENDRKLGLGQSFSIQDILSGGAAYGSYEWPSEYGSGGGCSNGPQGSGGKGGGVIWLDITDFLTMNVSTITANGEAVYGGGGGGAGGSIVLKCFFMYGGDDWTNKVTANGGTTCLPSDGEEFCGMSIDYPGGRGAGGRVAVHGNVHAYVSTLEALPDGLMYSNNTERFLQQHMGSVRFTRPQASLLYGREQVDRDVEGNEIYVEYVEVVYNEPPILQVESIVFSSASGSMVLGNFVLSYKYSRTCQLDASASAEDVRGALADLPGLSTVSVNRKLSASGGGYTWDVTFHHNNIYI